MKPIMFLELNEIPWRVLDRYADSGKFCNIKYLVSKSKTFTTIAADTCHLSPWITWPTIHRGMNNEGHKIYNLGQDPKTFEGVPIWEEFRKKKLDIGVFGALQSWPPRDPGQKGFYIPDTFAHDEQCIPKKAEVFQRFNLDMVSNNARVVQSSIGSLAKSGREFALKSRSLGITGASFLKTAKQLCAERVQPHRVCRRPVFQSILAWDIYTQLLKSSEVFYTSFFTNHVAGIMHRYWDHFFPEDFDRQEVGCHHRTMNFAMKFTDQMIGDAIKICRNRGMTLVVGSSMGQSAIKRTSHEGFEVDFRSLDRLMNSMEIERNEWTQLMAMLPQKSIEVNNKEVRTKLKGDLEALSYHGGDKIVSMSETGNSLSLSIRTPRKADALAGKVRFRNQILGFQDIGLELIETEAGTAYHIPEGVLLILDPAIKPGDQREEIQSDKVKELVLSLSGIN